MSTDPAEVASAMTAGQDAESARQAAGVPAVSAPPPPLPAHEEPIPPLRVQVTGPESLAATSGPEETPDVD